MDFDAFTAILLGSSGGEDGQGLILAVARWVMLRARWDTLRARRDLRRVRACVWTCEGGVYTLSLGNQRCTTRLASSSHMYASSEKAAKSTTSSLAARARLGCRSTHHTLMSCMFPCSFQKGRQKPELLYGRRTCRSQLHDA